MVTDTYSYPASFPEDLVKDKNYFADFEVIYTFFANGNVEMLMTKTQSKTKGTLKLTGTYKRKPKKFDEVGSLISFSL